MNIALSSDHTGFTQLRKLQEYLEEELGHSCKNFNSQEIQPEDDYPDLIFPAARAVASGECQMGIVLGGSGQGEAMAANRVRGVRCVVYYGTAATNQPIDAEGHTSEDLQVMLRLTREHNNANMLSLGARFLSLEQMKEATRLWLGTPFSQEPRHVRRIAKLDNTA